MKFPPVEKAPWIQRFAAKLLAEQPAVPADIAVELAHVTYSSLCVLMPEDAVQTLLSIQLNENKWAAGYAEELVQRLRIVSKPPSTG